MVSRIQACCAKTSTQNYLFGLELSCLPLNKTQRKLFSQIRDKAGWTFIQLQEDWGRCLFNSLCTRVRVCVCVSDVVGHVSRALRPCNWSVSQSCSPNFSVRKYSLP